jgi:hypothetical protein
LISTADFGLFVCFRYTGLRQDRVTHRSEAGTIVNSAYYGMCPFNPVSSPSITLLFAIIGFKVRFISFHFISFHFIGSGDDSFVGEFMAAAVEVFGESVLLQVR